MSSANADDLQFLPPAPPHPAQGLRPVGGKSLFLGFPSCSAMEAGEGADLRAMALLGWGGGFPPGGGGVAGAHGLTCFLGWGEGRSGTGGCEKPPAASSWSGTASATGHPAAFEGRGEERNRGLRD